MSRLITRTLTKYPVDYALFRELLQNSADAKAQDVVISFSSTIPGGLSKDRITDVGSCTVDRLTVKNNGQYFEEDDWNRLKEIAKGNPDESKIGAFGVGFYSVFELTDEPLVHSGETVMSFYYQGDQLCYRKETIEDSNKWTVIDLPYREPKPLPLLSQFIAFLTQSFVLVPLTSVTLMVDDIKLLHLKKVVSPNVDLPLPASLSYTSPDRSLRLKSWSSESFQLSISYMNVTQISEKITGNSFLSFGFKAFSAFVPSSKNPAEETQVTAFLRKVTGKLDVNVSSSFAKKMKDTVMKAPPKEAVISMLTENKDEKELSELKSPLAEYVFPKDFIDAKIFIGFPTKQSTSFKSHIAINQLIPTMERTAVDMSNAYVKDWNKQILSMAGVLSRTVYEYEFSLLKSKASKPGFYDDASYIMNRFDFQKSAPDQSVGKFIAYGFWKCANFVPIPSKNNVLPSTQVRLADDADFIEELPIVPQQVIDKAGPFLDRAVELGFLKKISAADIAVELQRGTLTPERFKKVISWCVKNLRNGYLSEYELSTILQSAIIVGGKSSSGSETLISLGQVTTYQDKYIVPEEYPLPPTCLPAWLVSLNSPGDFETLGWKPLQLIPWLGYACDNKSTIETDKNMFLSTSFSENVLGRLSRHWMTFSPKEQEVVKALLANTDCIPTQLGLKAPPEAYFEPIPLFPNLPVKTVGLVASKGFLLSLGLRESVDVAFVLKRINNPDPTNKWSTFDVVKYLSNLQSTLKLSDWNTLKESSFFEAEDGKLYKASELYAPDADLAKMEFPCLKWNYWHDNSPEAKFIYNLGLSHHPKVGSILKIAHDPGYGQTESSQETKASMALRYLLKNFDRNGYKPTTVYKTASKCVPCIQDGQKVKCTPSECYTDQKISLFGLPVISEDLLNDAWKFCVAKEPPVGSLVNILISQPPATLLEADKKFSYLSTVAGSLLSADRTKLKQSKFIPISKKTSEKEVIVHTYPSMVFFKNDQSYKDDKNKKFYNEFFDFVDFSPTSRPFLTMVGVREEPSITEIARFLVDDPMSMYRLAASSSRYLEVLYKIIAEWNVVSKDFALVSKMRRAKFLIAISHKKNNSTDLTTSDEGVRTLATVEETIIVDNVVYFNIFKYDVLTAPQDERLEAFYKSLGCRSLTNIVEETRSLGPIQPNHPEVALIKETLKERIFLFLESTRTEKLPSAYKLCERLDVLAVSSIAIERRIKFSQWSHSQPFRSEISACLGRNTTQEAHTLYVVPRNLEWFDVSQSIISFLVKTPSPEAVIVLENIMASNLKGLQRKGYNVGRILRKKQQEQEEADALEEAAREKLKAETQERIRLQKETLPAPEQKTKDLVPKGNAVADPPPYQPPRSAPPAIPHNVNLTPGAGNQPQLPPPPVPAAAPQKGFFSRMFRNPATPPTQQPAITNGPGPSLGPSPGPVPSVGGSVGAGPRGPGNSGKEGNQSQLLENGIRGSKPFTQNSLSSPPSAPAPVGNVNTEKECNSSEAQNLQYVTRLQGGPAVYTAPGMPALTDAWITEIARFKTILFIISQHIFQIPWDAVHVYLNTGSGVIAFNYGGSLFFNVSYFLGNSLTPAREPGSGGGGEADWNPVGQLDYWFTVFAHELAHNLCQPHGATHSYYTENYIQKYLERYKVESNKLVNGLN